MSHKGTFMDRLEMYFSGLRVIILNVAPKEIKMSYTRVTEQSASCMCGEVIGLASTKTRKELVRIICVLDW
jgi:hypothetical protein